MPYSFVYWILRLIHFSQFKGRRLTVGEIHLCKGVFGDLIDYTQVYIMNHPYLPWQSQDVLMAPTGYIHARNRHYRDDYSQQSLSYRALFIHEMAHIYQHQQQINVLLRGALLQIGFFLSLGKYNPYAYTLHNHKTFFDYNIEQQGDIARDIYLKKIPNIILNPQ